MRDPQVLTPDETWIYPFPNGSSWYDWLERNCILCAKASPDIGDRDADTCDLETRIWDEGMPYSRWSPETVARVGWDEKYLVPGHCKEFVPEAAEAR